MLTELSLFAGVNPTLLAKLEASAEIRPMKRGGILFAEGDAGDAFFVLRSGVVDIVRGSDKVARLLAGDFLGEMALITEEPRNATALVMEDGEVLVITRESFLEVFGRDPALTYEISRAITRRMSANEKGGM